jgi:hypothetical protein
MLAAAPLVALPGDQQCGRTTLEEEVRCQIALHRNCAKYILVIFLLSAACR